MRRPLFRSLALLLLSLLALSLPLMAQVDRGTITGKVTDPSGAVIPGVEIAARNVETGVATNATTNNDGLYTLSNVPIGTYEIRFTLTGFKTYSRTGIQVTVGQTLHLETTLEIGSISDTVTVSADATLMTTESPLVAQTLQSRVVTDLPLSFSGGRSIENFAYALTPAVEGNNWTSYIAGTPAFSKEVLIDGTPATAQIQGHVGESSPSMESIQEFSVQTSGMSAEYGHSSGGIFNFAFKSGTNNLHGSGYYYFRNEAINANQWMNNWQGSQCAAGDSACQDKWGRPRDRQSVSGGSLGGPVVIPKLYNGKNKTFLFGTFEHYMQSRLQLGAYDRTVPIPDFLDGNFSKLLTTTVIGQDALGRDVYGGQIFDPAMLRQVGGKWVSDPFTGNIIPKNRMSSVASKIIDIYRKEYLPMIPGRLINNNAGTQYNDPWFHQTQLTIKGDHAVSDANKFSGSLIWTQRPRILADAGGVWDPGAGETGGPLSRARKQEVSSRAIRLANNWNLRTNLINTAAFTYNRYYNPSLASASTGNWPQNLGLSGTGAGNFPEINFGDAINGIDITDIGYSSSGFYVANNYIADESVLWVKGRHNIKVGFQYWKMEINSHNGTDTLSFNFSNLTTGIPGASWANQVGFGFASFFLGAVNGASRNVTFDLYGRRSYVSSFFQDDFKVNSRLTLNLGLRWEKYNPFHEKYGRWANFSPTVRNTALNVNGALEFLSSPSDTFERESDWKDFSPRVGFAWRATNKAVIRGGYGIFFVPIGLQYWSGVPYGFAPGYRGTDEITGSGSLPRFNWDQGYPGNFKAPTKDANALMWGPVYNDPKSVFPGYTHQYNVSLEWEFNPNTMAAVTFMGNQGRRLRSGHFYRNQPTQQAWEDPKVDPTAWVWDAGSAAAAGVPYPYQGFSGFAGFALQPFPQVAAQWGPLFSVGVGKGETGYRSLQFSLTRRPGHGIGTQVSYNYSKALGSLDNAWEELWWVGGVQDMNNLSKDAKTVLGTDQTHIFKGYVSYELPFGHGRAYLANSSGLVNALLGGWTVSSIFKYNTGEPLGVGTNVWYPGWEGAIYADYDPSADTSSQFDSGRFNPGNQTDPGNRYFNTAAFSNPKNRKLGNGAHHYENLRTFGWANEDIGMFKYWHFKEGASFQLRFEMLNAFNRHHFNWPDTSIGSPTFGYVTSTGSDARVIQVGLRLGF